MKKKWTKRTKRYIGLVLGVLLALDLIVPQLGAASAWAASAPQENIGGVSQDVTDAVEAVDASDASEVTDPEDEVSSETDTDKVGDTDSDEENDGTASDEEEGDADSDGDTEEDVSDGNVNEDVSDGDADKNVSNGDADKDVSNGNADKDVSDGDLMLLDLEEEIQPLEETHVVYEDGSMHKPSRQTVIFEDTFENGNNWTPYNDASGKMTFEGGKVITRADNTSNETQKILRRMVCSSAGITAEKIEENQFLIQLDIIPGFASSGKIGAQVGIAFQTDDKAEGNYFQVRLHGNVENNAWVYVDQVEGGTVKSVSSKKSADALTWNANQKLEMDILVNTSKNSVTVSVDGKEMVSHTGATLGTGSGLAIIRSWGGANTVSIDNLKVTTGEEVTPPTDPEPPTPPVATHIPALTNTILDDNLTSDTNWNVAQATNSTITFGTDGVTLSSNGDSPDNRIGYKNKITAKKFQVSLDVTPKMTNSTPGPAADLKISFISASSYTGQRAHVRLSFGNGKMFVCRSSNQKPADEVTGNRIETALSWTQNTVIPLDVLVDKDAGTITIYKDGQPFGNVFTDASLKTMELGWFALTGQYNAQNFLVSNLKITTDEDLTQPDPDPVPDPEPEVKHALQPLSRELAKDDFEAGGGNWKVVKGANGDVTFANGKVTISGKGPCNMIGYTGGKINARDMLVQFDMTTNAGNTNSSAFAALRLADQFSGDHLYVRFDFVANKVWLQRTTDIANSEYTASYEASGAYNFALNKTYAVDILVNGKNLKVYINNSEVLNATDDNIAALDKGYFAIIGKYPAQDFSIDNLLITTNEVQTGDQYTVTLESATNGTRKNNTGGTVTADTLTGYAGDVITLTVEPKHGYVFDRFESYKADGSATDGLMPINNNKFALESKLGNVTVVAHFKTREPGRFELFYDDFAGASLDSKYKTKGPESGLIQADGVITVSQNAGSGYLLLDQGIFKNADGSSVLKPEDGYRISLDLERTTGSGTLQLMFRGTDTSINDRHVLGLNGTVAFIKPFEKGTGADNLKQENYTLGAQKVHVEIEVRGNDITCYAGGSKILEYTSTDDWKGQSPAVGLLNMTPNAPVIFDNLLVERMPPMVTLSTKAMVREGEKLTEDTTGAACTFTLGTYSAVEGDEIPLNLLAKPGYRLAECYVEDSNPRENITGDTYTVPIGTKGSKCIVAVFEPATQGGARDCYIDSVNGSDSNSGTQAAPWKSFEPLKKVTLAPGSHIYLKRGSVFTKQQLTFNGMGTKEKPITVDSYGKGNLPRLDGCGAVGDPDSDSYGNVVYLYNQEYITIRNLEITNTSPKYNSSFGLNKNNNQELNLRAIHVVAKDFGVVSGIRIQDCYIHDINGHIGSKWNGGIFFNVNADVEGGRLVGVPTKYDDVIIEGCTFINVDRSALKLVSSRWCNQWEENDKTTPVNWYPSTNVIVRNNYMEKIGGDGITVRDTYGALIEHNLAIDCRYQNTGYNVAIWPFQAASTVIQYNEAYNTHSITDGQGFDCDHASSYSVMQYNYSHNNQGGFMLIMGGYPHTAATVRYNISQDDKDKMFEFAQGISRGVMIYNNTLYSKDKVARGIFYLPNMSAQGGNEFYAFNNIFCFPAEQDIYGGDLKATIPSKTHLYNNAYVGGVQPPTQEQKAITIPTAAEVFVDVGKAPATNDTRKPRTGSSGALDGYQLKAGCELINAGVTMAEAITAFGKNITDVKDGRDMSPRNLYNFANTAAGTNSLNYVMADNFPKVEVVRYDLDFFGNSNKEGGKPDIGAAESLSHAHTGGEAATCVAKSICKICGVPYGALDPSKHTGGTEIRNAAEATTAAEGYTGDTYCKGCGEKLAEGTVIAKLPSPSSGGSSGGSKPSAPAEQKPTAPTEEQKPAPEEAEKPNPDEEQKPAPEEDQKPNPDEEQKPAPEEAEKPNPDEEQQPKPNDDKQKQKPKPADEQKPKQADEQKPAEEQKPADEQKPAEEQKPADGGKLTVAPASSEKLPDNMELKVAEVPKEQKAVLEKQATTGEHKEVFANLKMEFVEIQLILTENGDETQVHDKQVTFMVSLPKGVTKENHKNFHFFALHLKEDGSTELIRPESTEDGLRMTTTLSSFALGYGEHEEDGGITVKEATEVAEGEIAYSCIGCGTVVRTEAIPALGKTVVVEPTETVQIDEPKAETKGGGVSVILILCLAALAAGGIGAVALSRKRTP